jgi:hypothetical protein
MDLYQNAELKEKKEHIYEKCGEVVGEITPEIAKILGTESGIIILNESQMSHGLGKHWKNEIKPVLDKAGMQISSVKEFVDYVLKNVSAVYAGKHKNSFEIITDKMIPNGVTIIGLARIGSGGKYKVNTVHVKDSRRYKNKTSVWERRAYVPTFDTHTPEGSAIQGQTDYLNFTTKPDFGNTGSGIKGQT